ncbi:14688_t:CDS:1, partial [Acaulospora colombiana]
GANISFSLNVGFFAQRFFSNDGLSSKEGLPSVIIITDGVVKSNLALMFDDDDIIMKLCKDGIRCDVIQVGSRKGFDPGVSFGLPSDNEMLQFVATATSGVFLHSDDCPDIPGVDSGTSDEWRSYNFYQENMLLIETTFSKKNQSKYSNSQMDNANTYSFPWDPRSQPPSIKPLTLNFRDYSLFLVDVQQLILARMRHGFSVDSILLLPGRDVNINSERITVTMSRLWSPNISIQYKIKAIWAGEANGLSRLKQVKAEIGILSDTVFAMNLLNFQISRQNRDPNHPLYWRFVALYNFLESIRETDELLKKH